MNDGDDRRTILRRRSRFIGSALLALSGCAGTPPERGASAPKVSVPPAGETSEPEATPAPTRRPQAETTPLPPLDVPADAEGIAKSMYESLARRVPALHEAIDRLRSGKPAVCALSDASCERSWAEMASRIEELAGDVATLKSKCPGSSAQAERYAERVRDHIAHAVARLDALDREIAQAFGDQGRRWGELRKAAVRAEPMVCLDCADW